MPSTNGANGERDARGRFGRGNRGGPGNPFARQTAALRSALFNAITPDDVGAIARTLIERAKGGDAAAVKLLFGYVLPVPRWASLADPDHLDKHEYESVQSRPNSIDWEILKIQGASV